MKVSFLGLGAIGTPMARHVAAKGDLTIWNRTASTAAAFAASDRCVIAPTAREAGAASPVVITCLPTSREVEVVLDGPDGLLAGMATGSLLIDCTSGDPASSRRIAARLAERGIAFIDAPVSGGVIGAVNGALTVMCGGDEATFARALPVLQMFGKKIVHVGPVGAGDALKAVNNAWLATHIWAAAEGLAALTKAGVKPSVALEVINASSGRSNTSENLVPQRVVTGAFPRTFKLALLEKDVAIAAEFMREQRIPSAVTQQVAELFRVARDMLGEEADHVEAVQLIERWSGVEIRG
ncbi:MAG: NAD(P)-dependent oxidoreductase [Gemmatimonadetes bacterium]|nr:NAD(P)-dependent oxidoreductase [Gemmatimonadota bacterium]